MGAGRCTRIRSQAVALECAEAVLRLAFRADPNGDPALIAERERRLLGCLANDGFHPAD